MSHKRVDGLLLEWGAALFNESEVPGGRKSKKIGAGLIKALGQSAPRSAKSVRARLNQVVRRSPQVNVKITPMVPKGLRDIRRHVHYISREGELPLEDEAGDVTHGKEALQDLIEEWRYRHGEMPEEGKARQAYNIVLSMPAGTDPLGVQRAVRDFAAREFHGHQYVMALHTFDTDPDPKPSPNPHVHLVVRKVADDGSKLNPRKADLQRWRDRFAEALRDNGIEASSVSRKQRLEHSKGLTQAVRHKLDRGETIRPREGAAEREATRRSKAEISDRKVLAAYKGMAEALAASDDVADRRLAVDVVQYLNGQLAKNRELAKARSARPRSVVEQGRSASTRSSSRVDRSAPDSPAPGHELEKD